MLRRLSVALLLVGLAFPLRAQTPYTIPTTFGATGTVSLSDEDATHSILDFQFTSFFNPNLFSLPIQFAAMAFGVESQGRATLVNGATINNLTGPLPGTGPFFGSLFFAAIDAATLSGHFAVDATDYAVISPSCAPVPPDGFNVAGPNIGQPYWGSAVAALPFYFDTCAPGSFVDVRVEIPRAVGLVGLAPVSAVPEPGTLALMGTGLMAIVGGPLVRRRRRG